MPCAGYRDHPCNELYLLKQVRPLGTNIRILFTFDPRRAAILLLGGDKTGQWDKWYRKAIPVADDLYDEHLSTLKAEGHL